MGSGGKCCVYKQKRSVRTIRSAARSATIYGQTGFLQSIGTLGRRTRAQPEHGQRFINNVLLPTAEYTSMPSSSGGIISLFLHRIESHEPMEKAIPQRVSR